MSQFYLPGPWTPDPISASESLSHHLRVRRIDESETIRVFNGLGQVATARLAPNSNGSSGKIAQLILSDIHEDISTEPKYPLALAQGIAANEKMDWLIEKAVELGVTDITPLQAERSVVRLDEKRAEKRLAHWRAIIIAACEQSGRTVIPKLHALSTPAQWLKEPTTELSGEPLKIILSPRGDLGLVSILKRAPGQGICLMIGPEGGFSDNEELLAEKAGFIPALMGKRVLRTETAGIVAMSAVNTLWGGF
jgi:16S rRNA (uracil1498-N3)-methyltransferase